MEIWVVSLQGTLIARIRNLNKWQKCLKICGLELVVTCGPRGRSHICKQNFSFKIKFYDLQFTCMPWLNTSTRLASNSIWSSFRNKAAPVQPETRSLCQKSCSGLEPLKVSIHLEVTQLNSTQFNATIMQHVGVNPLLKMFLFHF